MTDQLYGGLDEPKDARRLLLESSRGVVKGLRVYEDLRDIRSQKIEISLDLNNQIRKLKLLMKKTKLILPKLERVKINKKHPLEMELDLLEREIKNLH